MKDTGLPSRVDAGALDYRALGRQDLLNIALQRSDVIADARRPGDLIRGWMAGDLTRFEAEVASRGAVLAQRAFNIIQREFEALLPVLDALQPRRIADIGCGYGFFGLMAYARYRCDLLLIDVENTDRRHFGFEEEGAGYADLQVARRFLEANGVPPEAVTTWNPEREDMDTTDRPDLAVSFLACGFHFPVEMYMPFFRYGVAKGGSILLDVRRSNFRENRALLDALGRLRVVEDVANRRRVIVTKGKKR